MQGLADGYFIIPYTIGNYLAGRGFGRVKADRPEFAAGEKSAAERCAKLLAIRGKRTVASFHRELGKLLWDKCGMARNAAGLKQALARIPELRAEFWQNLLCPGGGDEVNQSLEQAGRVADFLEFGELLCRDALAREESCGGHFREEHQSPEGEARRNDAEFAHVAVWEHRGDEREPVRHKEQLAFENVHLVERSYK